MPVLGEEDSADVIVPLSSDISYAIQERAKELDLVPNSFLVADN